MKTIWKYPLEIVTTVQEHLIPGWSSTSFVACQNGVLNVWCHVDTRQPNYLAKFLISATGEESPIGDFVYLGSAICGDDVWHVWRNAMAEKVSAVSAQSQSTSAAAFAISNP